MPEGWKSAAWLLGVAAAIWHLCAVLSPAWLLAADSEQARDFASYYYAVRVASDGGDPYDRAALNAASRQDGTRRGVHPFLYAPPFLLTMAWVQPLDLQTAYRVWFWLHEACALLAAVALWRWWRPLGGALPLAIAVLWALMTAIPNNHAMGQANFPGLLLALLGLWQTERGRPWLGGALLGVACMLKMSPALWVFWWLVRREWWAVAAAVATAVALSVLTLPLAGPEVQLGFYTRILPTFSNGGYNGLGVPIELFGNHSLPNLFHQWFPSGKGTLSTPARALSSAAGLLSLAGLALLFRAPPPDAVARAGQAAAFGVLLLLLPVYTYEHHLVFALPAAVLAVLAVERGWLGGAWAVAIGVAVTFLLFDLQLLRALCEDLSGPWRGLVNLVREAKMVSLLGLLAAAATLGIRGAHGRA